MADAFDLVVIGAGSGGVRAARFAGDLGARVAVVEAGPLGGTCVNAGCVPKKLLVYASRFGELAADGAGFGWSFGEARFDWAALRAAKDREIARLNGVYQHLLDRAGVEVVRGRGRLVGPHEVAVGERVLRAERILVATGGRPRRPVIPGAELGLVSDDLFHLPALPRRAAIVGGGYIAVEFAGILAGLGVQVVVLERSARVLRAFDEDISTTLLEEMRKRGVEVRLETRVECVERVGEALCLDLDDGCRLETDLVLFATGRAPNTAGLGLAELGVRTAADGAIEVVDDDFRTAVPSIHAVGDVIGGHQLTPIALAQGMVFARRLYGGAGAALRVEHVPTAVFSNPNVGTVGLTERAARRDHDVVVYRSRFKPMFHTMSGRDERTMMKIVVDRATDRVLGFHMVGPDAGEIVQGLGVAMTCGVTKAQLDATIGIHPTAAEEFVTMRTPVEG